MKSRSLIITFIFFLSLVVNCIAAEEHDHEHKDHHDEGKIHLSEESQKLGKIKTMPLRVEALTQRIMVIGKVSQDPERTEYITPKNNAVIKGCMISLGTYVKQDEELCLIQMSDGKEGS